MSMVKASIFRGIMTFREFQKQLSYLTEAQMDMEMSVIDPEQTEHLINEVIDTGAGHISRPNKHSNGFSLEVDADGNVYLATV